MWVKTYYIQTSKGIFEKQFTRFQKLKAYGYSADIFDDNVPEEISITMAHKLIDEWNRVSRAMKADYFYSLNSL